MNLRQDLGPFPIWLWLAGGAIALWYVRSRSSGRITPGSVPEILSDAIDQPQERAELVRGIMTGLISAILAFYLIRRWGRLR